MVTSELHFRRRRRVEIRLLCAYDDDLHEGVVGLVAGLQRLGHAPEVVVVGSQASPRPQWNERIDVLVICVGPGMTLTSTEAREAVTGVTALGGRVIAVSLASDVALNVDRVFRSARQIFVMDTMRDAMLAGRTDVMLADADPSMPGTVRAGSRRDARRRAFIREPRQLQMAAAPEPAALAEDAARVEHGAPPDIVAATDGGMHDHDAPPADRVPLPERITAPELDGVPQPIDVIYDGPTGPLSVATDRISAPNSVATTAPLVETEHPTSPPRVASADRVVSRRRPSFVLAAAVGVWLGILTIVGTPWNDSSTASEPPATSVAWLDEARQPAGEGLVGGSIAPRPNTPRPPRFEPLFSADAPDIVVTRDDATVDVVVDTAVGPTADPAAAPGEVREARVRPRRPRELRARGATEPVAFVEPIAESMRCRGVRRRATEARNDARWAEARALLGDAECWPDAKVRTSLLDQASKALARR